MNLAISELYAPHSRDSAGRSGNEIGCRHVVSRNRKFAGNSPSPPFRGEREGPRRDSAGEGEVGDAANCHIGPLTLPSSPRPAGGEG